MKNYSKKPEKTVDYEQLDYPFYWDSSVNTWNGTDCEEYKEYNTSIQVFLNAKYKEFLNGKGSVVKLIHPLQNYQVDFESSLQMNIDNPLSVRLIKLEKKKPNIINQIISPSSNN